MKSRPTTSFSLRAVRIGMALIGLLVLFVGLLLILNKIAGVRGSASRRDPKLLDIILTAVLGSSFVQSYFGGWVTRRNTSLNRAPSPPKKMAASVFKVRGVAKKVSFEGNKEVVFSIHDPPAAPHRADSIKSH